MFNFCINTYEQSCLKPFCLMKENLIILQTLLLKNLSYSYDNVAYSYDIMSFKSLQADTILYNESSVSKK